MGFELDKLTLSPWLLQPGQRPLLSQELLSVDAAHPIGSKIRAFYLGGQCNLIRDLAGNLADLEKAGTRAVPAIDVTNAGPVNVFAAASTQVLAAIMPTSRIFRRNGSFGYPCVIGARYKQKTASTYSVFGLDCSASTNAIAGVKLRNTGLGVYRYNVRSPDVDSAQVFYDGGTGLANAPHTVIGVSYSATDHRIFLDGVQKATATTSVNPAFSVPVDMLELGGNKSYTGVSDFDEFADMDFEFAFFSDELWTPEDIAEFSRDPYAVLKLRVENLWIPATAGGGAVNRALGAGVEAMAALAMASSANFESRLTTAKQSVTTIETTAMVSRASVLAVEVQSALAQQRAVVLESPSGLVTVSRSTAVPLEALQLLQRIVQTPVVIIQGISVTASGRLEAVSTLLLSRGAALEAGLFVGKTSTIPAELMRVIAALQPVPVEFIGVAVFPTFEALEMALIENEAVTMTLVTVEGLH